MSDNNNPHHKTHLFKKDVEEVIEELKKEGVTLENYTQQSEGLGDTLEKVFTKFGVTEEWITKALRLGGCGCQERKKFLNRIFPYRKKSE